MINKLQRELQAAKQREFQLAAQQTGQGGGMMAGGGLPQQQQAQQQQQQQQQQRMGGAMGTVRQQVPALGQQLRSNSPQLRNIVSNAFPTCMASFSYEFNHV